MAEVKTRKLFAVVLVLVLGASAAIVLLTSSGAEPGLLYGEFHDGVLFKQAAAADPEISEWDDAELWENASGATLQAKTFGHEVPEASVWLDGKMLAAADGFGQFWIELAAGEYALTGKCEGYSDQTLNVSIESGKKTYVNFILDPVEKSE